MSERQNDGLILNVVGEKVALGPLRRDLLPHYQRWMNDLDTAGKIGGYRPITETQEESWYDAAMKSETVISFTIYELETLSPIGTTSLMDIDPRNRKALFGIMIGNPEARGRGYGTETTRLILNYAFENVGLNNVMLGVYEFNRAGIRAYEKAGFEEIGRRRKSYFANGRWWDDVYMDALAGDSLSQHS